MHDLTKSLDNHHLEFTYFSPSEKGINIVIKDISIATETNDIGIKKSPMSIVKKGQSSIAPSVCCLPQLIQDKRKATKKS